jgi:hypothetical protein
MSIRDGIEQNRVVVVLICLAIGAAAVGLLFYWSTSTAPKPTPGPRAYFYDQNTGRLFTAPDHLGPIPTESGLYRGEPAGVRAHVFACGTCAEERNRFVGWLSRPASTDADDDASVNRVLIRRPTDSTWVPSDSPFGERILREVNERCKRDTPVRYCNPED